MDNSSCYRNHGSPWSIRELTFVENHYGRMKTASIAVYLGRSPVSVRAAARSLGCSRKNSAPWTDAEKDIVRAHYAKGGHYVSTLLPGRSLSMIVWMARMLGAESARKWSHEEECLLTALYPTQGTAMVDRLPNRTAEAVKLKACEMGVKFCGGGEGVRQRVWSEDEWMRLSQHDHLMLSELLVLFSDRSRLSVKKARERLRKWKKQGTPL